MWEGSTLSPVRIYNHRGFTLVEVLISLACMAIAFVSLWGVHYSSMKTDVWTELETGAVSAAHSQLDFLRTLAFTDPLLNDGNHTANANDPPLAALFTRSYTVATDGNYSWKKTIVVSVTWMERTGTFGGVKTTVPRTVRMSSIIVDLN